MRGGGFAEGEPTSGSLGGYGDSWGLRQALSKFRIVLKPCLSPLARFARLHKETGIFPADQLTQGR